MEQAGVIVKDSNNRAVRTALAMMGIWLQDNNKTSLPADGTKPAQFQVSEAITELLSSKPRVVNIGLKKFANTINSYGGQTVQYDWRPIAGGNERMRKILSLLK